MSIDRTGAREAALAAWASGFLFICMLGLLALSDAGESKSNSEHSVLNASTVQIARNEDL